MCDRGQEGRTATTGAGTSPDSCESVFRLWNSAILVVNDAETHPVFKNNALVTGPPHIRFYTGAPLVHKGHVLGTLCIMDTKPRPSLTTEELAFLQMCAEDVTQTLVARRYLLPSSVTGIPSVVKTSQEENLQLLSAVHNFSEGFMLVELSYCTLAAVAAASSSSEDLTSVIYVNRGWEHMSGHSSAECVGQSVSELLWPSASRSGDMQATNWAKLKHALMVYPAWCELDIFNKDGSQLRVCVQIGATFEDGALRTASRTAGPLEEMFSLTLSRPTSMDATDEAAKHGTHPPSGLDTTPEERNKTTLMIHVMDISEQQATIVNLQNILSDVHTAKASADQVDVAKRRFVAKMSHEIRTPLSSLIACAELMEEGQEGRSAEANQLVFTIKQASTQLMCLINDVLDFSEIESQTFKCKMGWFNLYEAVDMCMELQRHQMLKKDLQITYSVSKDTPIEIYGAETQLCQVITNLLTNACKFTTSGFVDLHVQSVQSVDIPDNAIKPRPKSMFNAISEDNNTDDDQPMCTIKLLFTVQDSGIGIPESGRDWLFELFSQGDKTRTRKVGGTGIGLVISQRLVELMGGKIWVVSTPNEGSTFSFFVEMKTLSQVIVPATVKRLLTSQAPARASIGNSSGWQKAVVITNNPKFSSSMRGLLEYLGFRSIRILNELSALMEFLQQTLAGARGSAPQQIVFVDEDNMPCKKQSQIRYCMTKLEDSRHVVALAVYTTCHDHDVNRLNKLSKPRLTYLAKPCTSQQLGTFLGSVDGVTHDSSVQRTGSTSSGKASSDDQFRVLIAEDHEHNQMALCRMLHSLGVSNITQCYNGAEARDIITQPNQKFHLVFMDVHMPIMDGISATQAIRLEMGDRMPIILALTADVQNGLEEECKSAGMTGGYVTKPISKDKIAKVISKFRMVTCCEDEEVGWFNACHGTRQLSSGQPVTGSMPIESACAR